MKKSENNIYSILKALGITPQFLIVLFLTILIFGIALGMFFKKTSQHKNKKEVIEKIVPTEAIVPESDNVINNETKESIQLANTTFYKNSVPVNKKIEKPVLAIIIDDMGIDMIRSKDILELNYPLNVSYLTYAPNIQSQINIARNTGKEVMLHIPRQALNDNYDYGGDYLATDKTREENIEILKNFLTKITGYIGVNNHMGSKFTADMHHLSGIMEELAKQGLAFIDSRTTPLSKANEIADFLKLPYVARDVFLDDSNNLEDIQKSLIKLENIAKKRGYAIAIVHPRKNTIKALKNWLPILEQNGLELVPISYIIKNNL